MVTKKIKHVPSWCTAANSILAAAGITRTELAGKLGVSHVVVVRHLNGTRTPSPENVARINRAIAKIVGEAHVALFLDDEALLCGLLGDPEPKRDALIQGTLGLLSSYEAGSLFRAGYRKGIEAYMRRCDDSNALRFAVEINRAFQRVLLTQLCPADEPIGFSEVLAVLGRHGFAADILTTDGIHKAAMERLQWAVTRELANASPGSTYRERHAAQARIFRVLDECFELRLRKAD